MATVSGTIVSATELTDSSPHNGNRHTALVTVDFAAYTGATDDATITDVMATITASHIRHYGKTATLRQAMSCFAGVDTNGQLVYAGPCTVVGDDITFNLTDEDGTELTSATACTGVGLIVAYDLA